MDNSIKIDINENEDNNNNNQNNIDETEKKVKNDNKKVSIVIDKISDDTDFVLSPISPISDIENNLECIIEEESKKQIDLNNSDNNLEQEEKFENIKVVENINTKYETRSEIIENEKISKGYKSHNSTSLSVSSSSNLGPNSLSSLNLKNSSSNINNEETPTSDNDQPPQLKTKRPSINFIKHITDMSYKTKIKGSNTITGITSTPNYSGGTVSTPNYSSSKSHIQRDEARYETISGKKSLSTVKKVIIRSDSNIIGHFGNVVVKEKKNKSLMDTYSTQEYHKKSQKYDDAVHAISYSGGTGAVSFNARHNIQYSARYDEPKAFCKSMPATVDYVDQDNENNKKVAEDGTNLLTTDTSSNGNINYNDFLFSDDETPECGEQSNFNHETTMDPQKKKKVKTNNKNVTFNEEECDYIPNVYEIHITEKSVLYCNNCKKKVHINVKKEYSKTFWVLLIALLICGVIFAWIPFLFNRFKFYSFYCKVCKKRIIKLQQADADD